MACTPVITLQTGSSTKNRLVYLITSGGGAGAGATVLANATMVADIADASSKLSLLIKDSVISSAALAFAFLWNNPQIRTQIVYQDGVTAKLVKPIILPGDDGGTDRLQITFTDTDTDAVGFLFIMEYRHSMGR